MKTWCLSTLLALLTVMATSRGGAAQPIEKGTWTGFVTPPGGVPYKSKYVVREHKDQLVVRITVPEWAAEFPFHDVHIHNDKLRFWWQPAERVDCELSTDARGVYRGECWDSGQNVAPIVMAPPGLDVDSEIDELRAVAAEAKQRNARWVSRRELDKIDGPRGEMVNLGDVKLNVLVDGDGPSGVVLLSDVGDDLRTWDYVVHDVKEFARVVSYSRAGIGYSEENPSPISVRSAAKQLQSVLEASGLGPPYVLVGHGFGAALAQGFASLHPDQVAGIVHVDPMHPELADAFNRLDSQSWSTYWDGQKTLHQMVPESVRAEFELYEKWIEDGQLDEIRELPDLPVVVISSLRASTSPRWIGEREEGLKAKRQVHARWADASRSGVHLVTDESGHYVQREDPDLVVQAIRHLLDQHPSAEPVPN